MARNASTINALITKHEAAIVKLREELANAPSEFVPAVGDVVKFIFGRAESKRELTGTVLAVTENEKGSPTVTILTGEGADTKVVNVLSLHVKGVPVGEVEPSAEEYAVELVE